MPTYAYRCRKGHEFELFHSIKDDAPKRCPKCRSKAVRIPSVGAGGLLFKGSGFYITDYRSESYRDKAKQEKGESKPAGDSATAGKSGDTSGSTPKSGDAPATPPRDKKRSGGEKRKRSRD